MPNLDPKTDTINRDGVKCKMRLEFNLESFFTDSQTEIIIRLSQPTVPNLQKSTH